MSIDYLDKYVTSRGFDFPRLINDDLFQPVRILFNNEHYVSATKLLLIAIDSIGFVEFGDIKENTFTKWLKTYADLGSIGITAEELWEHRNSLLHMSNLDSRKVLSGKVRRLIAYVGELPSEVTLDKSESGYFELMKLIKIVAGACGNWLDSYKADRSKFQSFVERYDLIASDARMMRVDFGVKN